MSIYKLFKLDSKKLDVEVKKTAEGTEVNVDAENGLLKRVGKLIGRVVNKKFQKRLL